jgi:hypothetical protein
MSLSVTVRQLVTACLYPTPGYVCTYKYPTADYCITHSLSHTWLCAMSFSLCISSVSQSSLRLYLHITVPLLAKSFFAILSPRRQYIAHTWLCLFACIVSSSHFFPPGTVSVTVPLLSSPAVSISVIISLWSCLSLASQLSHSFLSLYLSLSHISFLSITVLQLVISLSQSLSHNWLCFPLLLSSRD